MTEVQRDCSLLASSGGPLESEPGRLCRPRKDRVQVPVSRRAMTLLEVTVAAALLAVLLTTSAQLLRALKGQQRAAERRAVALQTVQALSERINNMPWDEVTPEAVRGVEIPSEIAPHLPGAELVVAVVDEQEPIAAKRISMELKWNGPGGQPARPARLTTWVFPEAPPAR